MTDEQRMRQTLDNIKNDSVVVSRLLLKYETEAEIMSVIGAVFDTWCDAHGVPTEDRRRMLHRLLEVFERTRRNGSDK